MFVFGFILFLCIGVVDRLTRPPMRRKPEPTLSERIMKRECDLGMCDFAGHDHTQTARQAIQFKNAVAGTGKVPIKPPPKAMAVSAVDAYRKTLDELNVVKKQLERSQKDLVDMRQELDGFKHRFNYRRYESGSDYEKYTVHEISTHDGKKMIYTEPKDLSSYYADDVFSRRENGYDSFRSPAPEIPTKRTPKF
jgi:hypothetical protein